MKSESKVFRTADDAVRHFLPDYAAEKAAREQWERDTKEGREARRQAESFVDAAFRRHNPPATPDAE